MGRSYHRIGYAVGTFNPHLHPAPGARFDLIPASPSFAGKPMVRVTAAIGYRYLETCLSPFHHLSPLGYPDRAGATERGAAAIRQKVARLQPAAAGAQLRLSGQAIGLTDGSYSGSGGADRHRVALTTASNMAAGFRALSAQVETLSPCPVARLAAIAPPALCRGCRNNRPLPNAAGPARWRGRAQSGN